MDTQNNTDTPEFFFYEPIKSEIDLSFKRIKLDEELEDLSKNEAAVLGMQLVRTIYSAAEAPESNVGGSDEMRFIEFSPVVELHDDENDISFDTWTKNLAERSKINTKFKYFESTVPKQKKEGLNLTDVDFLDYGNGQTRWRSFYTEEASTVTYVDGDNIGDLIDLVNVQIKEKDKGIVNIEYGDGTWVATLDDRENFDGLTTASGKSDFDDIISEIDRRDGQDLDLVDLEYGDGEWFARFEDNPGTSNYTTSKDYETFEAQIETQKEDGFDLIDVEYADDAWYGVYSNVATIPIEEVAEPVSSSTSTTTQSSEPFVYQPIDLRYNTVLKNNANFFNNLNF